MCPAFGKYGTDFDPGALVELLGGVHGVAAQAGGDGGLVGAAAFAQEDRFAVVFGELGDGGVELAFKLSARGGATHGSVLGLDPYARCVLFDSAQAHTGALHFQLVP